eukprot:Gb_37876 [translate_table: standard]
MTILRLRTNKCLQFCIGCDEFILIDMHFPIKWGNGCTELRKHLNLDPLIKVDTSEQKLEEEEIQQRAVVNDDCPKCHHPQLEYYTRQSMNKFEESLLSYLMFLVIVILILWQLRSADEGQTVFYECPNCRYKFAQNT